MRLPRKAVLLRLAIYIPLLGFFGWRALQHYLSERDAESQATEEQRKLDALPPEQFQTFTLPDGTVKKVPILTPEQAEEIYGVKVPAEDTKQGEPEAAAAPAAPEPPPQIQNVPGD